ncbi:MAG TPA: ABC transporter transmembrane domain-containing protein [Stellaceae bacterium]|nr:ABC transporter transmembrane domain-containing protein [Stellaceae bacterium]
MPLELQRRIVNEAIHDRSFDRLALLCAIYAAVALLQGGSKVSTNIYKNSVGEAASRRLRLDTYAAALHHPQPETNGQEGIGISIILSEADSVGLFIGTSISEPVLHGGVLISVFTYLLFLQPWMAMVALALVAPQFVFVPMMQNAINRRTISRIKTLRDLSVDIVNETAERVEEREAELYRSRVNEVYDLNMQIYRRKFSMNFLMNLLYHLGIVGILFVGGMLVMQNSIEVGTVVAFISGLAKVNDPWGDLVNFFRDVTNTRVKFRLIVGFLSDQGGELCR